MISTNTPVVLSYAGNGSATEFPITFPTFEDSDIVGEMTNPQGVVTKMVLGVDFTLENIGAKGQNAKFKLKDKGNYGAGPVPVPLPVSQAWFSAGKKLATGYTLYIKFSAEAFQPAKLTDSRFLPPTIERVMDRLTMHILAVKAVAGLAIGVAPSDTNTNPQLPPLAGNNDRILQVKSDGTGFTYGATSASIFQAKSDAANSAAAAALSEASALASKTAANTSKIAAKTSEDAAEMAEVMATAAASHASDYAQDSKFWSNLDLYTKTVDINFAMSPYTVKLTDNETLFLVDDSAGNVVMNMPAVGTTPIAWKVGIYKTKTSVNHITVVPNLLEKINTASTQTLQQSGVGSLLYAGSPTNWTSRLFLSSTAPAGGSSLPPISGFSSRFNENFSSTDLEDTINKILKITYAGPLVGLGVSPSNFLREKGTVVASVTMSASTTKRSNPITQVRFYRNGVLVSTNVTPNAAGGTETFVSNTSFSDDMSFSADVGDGTSTSGSNTVTYSYVYPYYYGVGAPGLTASGIAALTKAVIGNSATVPVTSSPTSQAFYFAYPNSYGLLTSILDPNGFETISGYTTRTVSITGLDGTAQSYRVYESVITTQVGFTNTYKR